MRKKTFTRQFKNFRIYKDLYGKPCKRDWMAKVVFLIQMLQTFAFAVAIATFEING